MFIYTNITNYNNNLKTNLKHLELCQTLGKQLLLVH